VTLSPFEGLTQQASGFAGGLMTSAINRDPKCHLEGGFFAALPTTLFPGRPLDCRHDERPS
jgi:hypothetical protein